MQELTRLFLEAIVKAIPVGVVVIEKDRGKIIYVNDRAIELYGVDPRGLEMPNHSAKLMKFLTLKEEVYPPEKLPVNISLLTGKKAADDIIIERPDGSRVIVTASAMPIRDEKSAVMAAVGIFEDITECTQIKQKLEEYAKNLENLLEERTKKISESEERYRELYESFDEAFIATDWEFSVIHWNKAAERITRVAAKDALGKKVYDVLPEMLSVDITPYFEVLQQRKPARFMMNTVSRQTGSEAIFEISTYPSSLGIIIIVEDKTDEEQTKRLSAIGQTAGMVGHDIRNPLQAMISDVYLLKADLADMPESETKNGVSESLESIEKNINYINKIVADLQDYARPLKPEYKDAKLPELITSIFQTISLPEKIKISMHTDGEITLRTDPVFIRRVLTNLATNAIQAMPEGGTLQVAAYKEQNMLVLTVSDTGKGIPDELKPKIFMPLVTTKAKGQGFGLAVVKRLVEALHGTLTFESEIGKGTKFIIELPLEKQKG